MKKRIHPSSTKSRNGTASLMSVKLLTPAIVLEDRAGWAIAQNHHAASLQVRPV